MKEPYARMLAGYEDHWLIGRYLRGDQPDWSGLAVEEKIDCLSVGEKVLLDFVAAWANTQIYLDEPHRLRIADAMAAYYCDGWI